MFSLDLMTRYFGLLLFLSSVSCSIDSKPTVRVATRAPGPVFYGKTDLLSQSDRHAILAVVQAKADMMQPPLQVRSVEVLSASEVEVRASNALAPGNYRLTEQIEYHFILRHAKNRWRIIEYGRAVTVATTGLTSRWSELRMRSRAGWRLAA